MKKNFGFKILKFFVIFFIVVFTIVLALGFLFPGLIWNEDLGVDYSKADYESIIDKLGVIKDDVSKLEQADYTYKYGEIKKVDVSLTSSELTAFFNYNRPKTYPLKDVQIRVNADSTIDAVAVVNIDYFLNDFLSAKYSKEELEKQLPFLGIMPSNVNLSLKFSGSVTNNTSSVDIISAKVQGISVPSKYITTTSIKELTNGVDKVMDSFSKKSNASFDSILINDSTLKFKGNIPSSLTKVLND